ncbi:MAG: hypothetical protein M9892_11190 [Bacteroidetes bacterium]|nr:hypothetical protein [Bacteroidota bacterium]
MKKLITILSSILLLLIVFSNKSCTKDKNDCFDCTDGPRDTLYIEKDFLDYWYAETGSWWVFKRTDTVGVDIYDTMRVVYHTRKVVFDNLINGFHAFEKCDLYFTHSNFLFKNPEYRNSIVGEFDAGIESSPYSNINKIYYGWVMKDNSYFYVPADSFGRRMLDLEFPLIVSQFDSRNLPYIIEESDFILETPYGVLNNTLILTDKSNLNVRFCISRSIGISRMEIHGGQIWELIDCNIIRTQ